MKKNERKLLIGCGVLIIILLSALVFTIYNRFKIHYSVSDRTYKIKEVSKNGYPVVGWIKVQGTNIDYPVLDSSSESYSISDVDIDFAWTNSFSNTLNNRTVISGHNIRNVSSKPLLNEKTFNNFENLPSYLYYDFIKDNKYVQYTINNKNYLYKIYGVSMIDSSKVDYDQTMTIESRDKYIKTVKQDSYFDFDIDVNSSDKLITLVTCTRFFGKTSTTIVVDGRMVRKDEKVRNYKVTKNNSYNDIERTMKGGDDNDEKA